VHHVGPPPEPPRSGREGVVRAVLPSHAQERGPPARAVAEVRHGAEVPVAPGVLPVWTEHPRQTSGAVADRGDDLRGGHVGGGLAGFPVYACSQYGLPALPCSAYSVNPPPKITSAGWRAVLGT